MITLDYQDDGFARAMRACILETSAFGFDVSGEAYQDLQPLLDPDLFQNLARLGVRPRLRLLQTTITLSRAKGMRMHIQVLPQAIRFQFEPEEKRPQEQRPGIVEAPGQQASSEIRATLDRLRAYFVSIEIAPPASQVDLKRAAEQLGRIPSGMTALFLECSGLKIRIQDLVEGSVYSLTEALEVHGRVFMHRPEEVRRLLPIRGDGCGNFDCVITSGPGAGAVVFWEHERGERAACLVASSVPKFLDIVAQYLMESRSPDGQRSGSTSVWLWQPERLLERDPGAARLLRDPAFVAGIHQRE